ncbi:hypothetical protein PPMP20_21440 [Paraburkholderia phymatum]|uniref:Uncharacterized protein n=1 Tax=Paraburkholderia phymatum (strain DSM 17167 / CIP 108236 / LMG 21445 / STM815) TaxID=391038 RepID=B2JMG1_PARP8|nr:hypothetical protein [Paraburkholderia phymatum]ACC74296.1 conserved hypothetical protein [Paraburkholderia phymatum STM815]
MGNARSIRRAVDIEVDAQVTLLTLIVALHLLVYAETRWWLTASQAVDAMRRWHVADKDAFDVMRRVALSSRALPLAMRLVECHASLRDPAGLQAAFTDQLQIDKQTDQYRIIRGACEAALVRV